MEDVVLVQPGYTSAVDILNPGGPEYRVLVYDNNDPEYRLGFEHRCKIRSRGRTLPIDPGAPWLQGGHQVIQVRALRPNLNAEGGNHDDQHSGISRR